MALEESTFERLRYQANLPSEPSGIGTAYYLGDGRNAWHRTWVNVYNPRSVAK